MRRSVLASLIPCLALLGAVLLTPAYAAQGAAQAPAASPPQLVPSFPSVPAASASQPQGQLLDRVVAIVNDGVVLQSQLDQQVNEITARLSAQLATPPPSSVLRRQVLNQLILQTLEDQEAKHAGVTVSDDQVNAALQNIAKRQHLTLAQLPAALSSQGVNYPQYREQLRRAIARQILVQQQVIDHINITPRELTDYMQQEKYTPTDAYEYNVSHILIAVPENATPGQIAQASRLAHNVDQRAKLGDNFANLAITYSASETALHGGELGWRKGDELPTFLADVIARLKPGQVSSVVQSSTGFNIVRLNAERPAGGPRMVEQLHLRHILLTTSAVEDNATVRQRLERMRTEILAGKEKFAVLARTESKDAASAVNGGDLGWVQPADLAPRFAAAAKQLKPGQISQPFQSRFGWHIVQLLGRRRVDISQTEAKERAFEALRASRAEEATELWRQQLRDDAYVKVLVHTPGAADAAG